MELIGRFTPQDFAIEAPFFGKNVQSMLKLGRAQGVAIATAMHAGIPVTEYSPKKVKQSITGNGNSEKAAGMEDAATHPSAGRGDRSAYDASDAVAVAVCHHFQNQISERIPGGPDNSGRTKKAGQGEDGEKSRAAGKISSGRIRVRCSLDKRDILIMLNYILSGGLLLVFLRCRPIRK
jgi:hypothetical protein